MKTESFIPSDLNKAVAKHWNSHRRTDRKNELLSFFERKDVNEVNSLLDTLKRSEDKLECNQAADKLRLIASDSIQALRESVRAIDLIGAVGGDTSAIREQFQDTLLKIEYIRDRVAAPWVDAADIEKAVTETGVQKGDILLVHSSYSKLGHVIGGAQAVIDGLRNALGENGTLVMPTLSQENFTHAYEEWSLDRPSDVGFLTEYFRKLPGVDRSNQETHSVAALGKYAYELTKDHCAYGPRVCLFGEYAFGHSSPWQKMYDLGGKVLFLGALSRTNTYKHFIECNQIERRLEAVKDPVLRQELIDGLWKYEEYDRVIAGETCKALIMYDSAEAISELDKEGYVSHGKVGDADLLFMDIQTMVREITRILESDLGRWYKGTELEWFKKADSYAGR